MKKSILNNSDEIKQYVKDIRKIPVISHERQEELFTMLQDKNISKHQKFLIHTELIKGNLRFVISVAKTFQTKGMDLLDVISEGNIGLIKAAERFDPTSGVKFISYAVWWIRQSIMQSLNENSRTIRIPSNLVQDAQKARKEQQTEDSQYIIKVEDESGEPIIGTTLPYCVGLYNEINEEGDQLIDVIPNKESPNPEDSCNTPEEIKKKVSLMLAVLDEREKIIIEKYYGLTGVESNLEDLGEEFGCTKERIRQLRDKAIKKLRNESFGLLNYL
jgi:RNA polymerase primary sigma factor